MRSASEPHGLPGLIAQEWHQLQISDRLIRLILDIILALPAVGMCGFVEHPQFPIWIPQEKSVSIWALSVIKYLKQLQCFLS